MFEKIEPDSLNINDLLIKIGEIQEKLERDYLARVRIALEKSETM